MAQFLKKDRTLYNLDNFREVNEIASDIHQPAGSKKCYVTPFEGEVFMLDMDMNQFLKLISGLEGGKIVVEFQDATANNSAPPS